MLKKMKRSLLMILILAITAVPIVARAAALSDPYANLSASVDGYSYDLFGTNYCYEGSSSNGNVTMTVKGTRAGASYGTLTLINKGDVDAQLSFTYTVSGGEYTDFTVAGNQAEKNGTYSDTLAAGNSIEIYLSVKKFGTFASPYDVTVTLSNVKLEVASAAKVTVSHNGLGTVSVGGTVRESGTTVEVEATGTTLLATPGEGAVFVGWINTADNSVVHTTSSIDYVPTGDASLKAIFAKSTHEACFWGSSKSYLFESLSAAITHASSVSNKTITLAYHGTLSGGNYIIPSNVTLLIPFDDNGTMYTAEPGYESDAAWKSPSAYCTLNMVQGANITVNGAISVSAKVSAKMGYAGTPTVAYGHISMDEGSSITVNNGANLYTWGYITGTGTVTIKSGATVYESFQVVDWRGGTATTSIIGFPGILGYNTPNEQKVFPMSQYYVQNVEVLMVLEAGATEKCSLIAEIGEVQKVTVSFLGRSDCMFNLTDGFCTKRYDGNKDRLVIGVNGTLAISQTEIILIADHYKIDLKDFVLPINGNITVNVDSGGTLSFNQDASLLPGAQVNIAEGTTVQFAEGKRLFVYDETEWKAGKYVYSNAYFRPVRYAPGQKYTRTADADIVDARIVVNGTLDASAGYLYTTAGGANICSTANGVVKVKAAEASPTLYEAVQDGTSISYSEIDITAAQLKNEDNSYVETAGITEVTTYNYDHHNCGHGTDATHGVWYAGTHEYTVDKQGKCTCEKHEAVTTVVPKTAAVSYYDLLAEAVGAYTSNDGYIQMLANTTEPSIDTTYTDADGKSQVKTVYLNLNSKTVTLTDTKGTAGAGTLTADLRGMDTGTDAFLTNEGDKAGSFVGNVTVAPVASHQLGGTTEKHYVPIQTTTDNIKTTQFHRAAASFNAYRVDRAAGEYYMTIQGALRGTADAVEKVTSMGFVFVGDTDLTKHAYKNGETPQNYGQQIDYLTENNAVDSVYVVYSNPTADTESAQYVYINYTFKDDEEEHDILCRVIMDGGNFDSVSHVASVEIAEEYLKEISKEAAT